MATAFEIPLQQGAQRFFIALGGTTYQFTLVWNTAISNYVLDIADANQSPLVQGIPLTTGGDLLGQHRHLGFTGSLIVQTDSDAYVTPTYDNIGSGSHLYFVSDA